MRQHESPSTFQSVDVEEVRRFWNARPCNIRHSPEPIGTRAYFDQVEARKYLVEPHIPGFAEFPRWKDKKVLEIGCGLGTDTINFARAGADVTAVDLSEVSLDLARKRANVFGLQDRIDFVQADAERLSDFIEPQVYDLVYSFGVIHHSPQPRRVVDQVRQFFTGPDSEFKVMVYNRRSWKVFQILLAGKGAFWKIDDLIARNSEAQSGSPVTYTYSPSTLAGLLDGFEIRNVSVDHIFPYVVADYVQYRYRKTWYIRHLPAPWFRWLERHLGWHLLATAIRA